MPLSIFAGGLRTLGLVPALSLAAAALTCTGPAQSQLRDTSPDTWEATDGLGRSLPGADQAGVPNQRQVLVFYYFWHQRTNAAAPYDISKIIAGKVQPFSDATFGPSPAFHHWGEPALGYYDINDEFVLRRHAQLLSDAGVDGIVLDVTNAATYDATWQKLCSVYADLRAAGNRTPLISFIANSSSDATVQHLYDTLYSKNECQGLLYQYQGKPLILAARGDGLSQAAKDAFTFRQSWAWTDSNGWFGDGHDKWPWLDNFPQNYGWHDNAKTPEEMAVGVAQHPTGNYGRSHHAGKQPPLDASYNTADTAKGLGFQEQWDRALEVKPEFVFVTQWNEWIAQRFVKCGQYDTGATQFLGKPLACNDTHFIDDFNQEFSRDIEPMRGGHEDAYYYQLVANVRRFKGARSVSDATPARRIASLTPESFRDVGPDYLDDSGDVMHRSALGYAEPAKVRERQWPQRLRAIARRARRYQALLLRPSARGALAQHRRALDGAVARQRRRRQHRLWRLRLCRQSLAEWQCRERRSMHGRDAGLSACRRRRARRERQGAPVGSAACRAGAAGQQRSAVISLQVDRQRGRAVGGARFAAKWR